MALAVLKKQARHFLFALIVVSSAFSFAADAQDTASQYATQTGQWQFTYLPLRAALHKKIVDVRMQAGASDEKPRLIFTAGPAGAGKSFVASALEKLDLLDVSRFIWIDPDAIKEDIPEYKDLKQTKPEDAASLVHRESGHIQEELFEQALRSKKNIIVDGTLLGKDWWVSEFRRIRQSHPEYAISIISVNAPEEILLQRVEARGKVTGRFVPRDLVIKMSSGVRESVEYLSAYADLTLEIENGISPAVKSVQVRGKKVPTHFDLTGQLGLAIQKSTHVELSSSSELMSLTRGHRRTVVLAGYGRLGYEDFSLLKSYVDQITSTYSSDTLFVLTHQEGVGRARDWIAAELAKNPTRKDLVVIAADNAVDSIFSDNELKQKIEVVALRGEAKDAGIIQSALTKQVPVVLVRDIGLDPETEAVALQLTRDPRFDSDPTKKFENMGYKRGPLRLVRGLEIPAIQRKYESRTRKLRDLYRRVESVTDQELIRVVLESYPELILLTEGVVATPEAIAAKLVSTTERVSLTPELGWLGSKNEATYPKQVGSVPQALEQSLATSLFNKPYPEFDRTIAALLLFKRLIAGDYDGFVHGQPENIKLSRESFLEISKLVRRVAFNPSMRDALFSFLIFNNIGKSEAAISYLKKSSGIQETNHQRVMSELLKLYPFISPTYQRLDEFQRQMVVNSFEKEFNLAQLAQGEAPARLLKEHANRSKDARDFYLATSILKIAAARGQDNINGSLVLTEPTYAGIRTAMGGIEGMANTEESIKATYQEFLRQRSSSIMPDGSRPLWMTRVGLMFRCQTAADGEELFQAIQKLPANERSILEREFSATGFKGDPALLLYYGPAMLDNLRKTVSRADFFKLGVQVLAQVMQAGRQEVNSQRVQEVLQVRMDAIAKQIRDGNGLTGNHSAEIYRDSNYGIAARLKAEAPVIPITTAPTKSSKPSGAAGKSCSELFLGK